MAKKESSGVAALECCPTLEPCDVCDVLDFRFRLPYRPVEVSINGYRLGVADGIWKSSMSFRVGREWLRPGETNTMTFETANAGPITGDARELGFALMGVRIDAAGQ